jgi:RimJ/RimL family protein N-acetyltransferase
MSERAALTEIWPLFVLRIATPRLELRLPLGEEIVALARAAARGIQPPGEPRFQAEWLYQPSPRVERGLIQLLYGDITRWSPDDWSLGLAAFVDGQPIGLQHVFSKSFAQTRGFGSGVWIGREFQGRGYGTELGRAVLKLGFDGQEAYIGAWSDNLASIRVMEKLGYVYNGQYLQLRDGECVRDRRMRLPRESWRSEEHADIVIEGLASCLELFGLPPIETVDPSRPGDS